MEIYDNNKSERVDDETNTMRTKSRTMMKVMARVDDIVPKIALVGDEKGTLFALDVKSGEILCKYDSKRVAETPSRRSNLTQSLTTVVMMIAVKIKVVKRVKVVKKWSIRESSWDAPTVR